MPVNIPTRIRGSRSPILATLLITAIGSLAGCDAAGAAVSAEAHVTATPGLQTFIARPRQHLLFTAKPNAPAAEVEAYFKSTILPALRGDARIGDVATYVDARTGAYLIEVELRTLAPAQLSLAVDVLATGRSLDAAERIIRDFTRYFDASSAIQLMPRRELSLTRTVLGTLDGGKS